MVSPAIIGKLLISDKPSSYRPLQGGNGLSIPMLRYLDEPPNAIKALSLGLSRPGDIFNGGNDLESHAEDEVMKELNAIISSQG